MIRVIWHFKVSIAQLAFDISQDVIGAINYELLFMLVCLHSCIIVATISASATKVALLFLLVLL